MIKKVFRPFWSFDVEKTEEWLSSMASKGLHFVKIQPLSSYFVFEMGNPKEVQYRIGYDKNQNVSLPSALVNDGWMKLFKLRNWYILINEQPLDQIKTFPHHEGVINHNRNVMHVCAAISSYLVFSFLFFFSVTMYMIFFAKAPVTFVGSPYWAVSIFVWLVGFLILYGVIKLYRSNQRFSGGLVNQKKEPSIIYEEAKRMKQSGELIVKRRFAWRYSPDKLEDWLEQMELEGYNLYSISKSGTTFVFIKGQARKVRYCIDFQNTVNQSYFHMHEESGWKLVFKSHSLWTKWNIWAFEYEKDAYRPQIYSDKLTQLKHARRITIMHLALLIPILLLVAMVLRNDPEPFSYTNQIFTWILWLVFGLGLILNGLNAVQSMLYYFRVKKSLQ